jgi:sterol-4alpha-carboxylate 3-dehydrogenase (decarboxylating)
MPPKSSAKIGWAVPKRSLVTGGSGFVGHRLVEMLVERGAEYVCSFDVAPKPSFSKNYEQVKYVKGDLTNMDDVRKACQNVDCVFHIAALVGPYHPADAYVRVNRDGTANILNICKELGIKRFVMSSSPSTRFPYPDPNVNGYSEDDLYEINKGHYAPVFLQPYAKTKAQGEQLVREACGKLDDDLLTIAVAPHQVYGPQDSLFLPSLLMTAASGKLRIFGNGQNSISFCHVDNYCHGLILGYEALYENSPALGKFYVITDGAPQKFWSALDQAVVGMGFTSLWTKMKLPTWFMMSLAYICVFIGNCWSFVSGTPKHVVNYKLKLNPFAVQMLVINRYFNIDNAKKDLKYKPVIEFDEGWADTIEWFKENWLPSFKAGNTHKPN